MHTGIFSAVFHDLPFEQAMDKIAELGFDAVEVSTGNHHCPLDELLENEHKRKNYLKALESRRLILSALNCPGDLLSPDKSISQASGILFRRTVELAQRLEVPVVNVLSGLPAGAPGDTRPNWVTCPWPPHFLETIRYQWEQVGIPWWSEAGLFAAVHGVKIAMEMHPGMLVYNVESLLRLRSAVGPVLGCNFDPSHLFWNGVDPVAAIRKMGDAIFHVHGKDCYVDPYNLAVNGCNDPKEYSQIAGRAWTFRTVGYGHEIKVWKDIVSALRLVGYNYVISLEHEDAMMSFDEGIRKGLAALKEAVMVETPGKMFWV
jgi:sugar phosphate isomerase/epimerase